MLQAETTWHRLGTLWIGLCLLLAAVLAWQLPHSRINTSLMDLLPHASRSDLDPALQQGLLQQLDRQLVWMLSLPAGQNGQAAAELWITQLGQIAAFSHIKGHQPELASAWQDYLHDLAWQRLDEASRARLAAGAEGWSQWVLGQIYSPFGGVSRAEWQSDPLLLTRAGVLAEVSGPMQLKAGWLVSRDKGGRDWYMVRAELDLSAFDIQRNQGVLRALDNAEQRLALAYPGAELLRRGTLFYSQHASNLAQQDISTIGLGSMIGVILLIWGVFRSTRALLLSLLPIGVGLMWGLGAVLILFGEIHVFTLVISSSLIGIAIDYAIHFLCDRRLHGGDESAHQTRLRLLPSLSLAVLTTLIGYGLLWFAPFPGLQQLAVCALAGLFSAFITVLCLFPRWAGPLPTRPLVIQSLLMAWLRAWRQRPLVRIGLPLCCLLLAALGISQLRVDDDIRRLQPLPVELQAQENQIKTLTGQQGGMQGFLVTGADGEQALQRLERLDGRLAELKQRGVLQDFVSLSRWLPSLARQQQDAAAIRALLPQVVTRLQEAGVPIPAGGQAPVREPGWLTPAAWLASPVSEGEPSAVALAGRWPRRHLGAAGGGGGRRGPDGAGGGRAGSLLAGSAQRVEPAVRPLPDQACGAAVGGHRPGGPAALAADGGGPGGPGAAGQPDCAGHGVGAARCLRPAAHPVRGAGAQPHLRHRHRLWSLFRPQRARAGAAECHPARHPAGEPHHPAGLRSAGAESHPRHRGLWSGAERRYLYRLPVVAPGAGQGSGQAEA